MAKKQILTSLGDTDLLERLSDAKEELFNLRFQLVTGQLENHTRVREVKKEVKKEVKVERKKRKSDILSDSDSQRDAPPPPARRKVKPEPPLKKKKRDILSDSDSDEFD